MNRINDWVKSNTGGKIEKMLSEPPAANSKLVLVNAVYFKGEWTKPFSKSATTDGQFHLADGADKNIPFMSQSGSFAYAETAEFQAVRLPYRGDRMNMVVVLPSAGQRLVDIQASLFEHPDSWLKPYSEQSGTVELPRFKLEYGKKLNEALIALGMGIAFDQDRADFSRMAPDPPNMFIGSVDHRVYIEVDEKGTKAAAATSVSMLTGTAVNTKRFNFRADRPFLFAIEDRLTNTILFVGTVYDPGNLE